MKVKELIALLKAANPEANVFHGYDGDVVVTEPGEVMTIGSEDDIRDCWFRPKVGDVVILEA